MAITTVEQLTQRLTDADLISAREIESCWAELGTTKNVGVEEFRNLLIRRELLTKWQIDRLVQGKRDGYFYGKYKVLYYVGAGTFARVYRAAHREDGKMVAIKVLRQRYSDDMTVSEQFMQEAENVKPLRHPNIVPVYEVTHERNTYFMVMDFVEGQNLREFMKVRKQLPPADAFGLVIDVLAGLDYAFARGVTHRDIKLSNVLVSSKGQGRLVDFGLAHVGSSDDDNTAGRSIDYAGLERSTSVRKNDKRSDIFFVGGMLYQLLSGQPALSETRDRLQRLSVSRYSEITPITKHMPELPHRVAMVVGKAMELNPERRYQTPGEMLADLKVVQDMHRNGTLVDESSEEVTPNRTEAPEFEGEGHTVMVIESNPKMQDLLREKLKSRGYRVLVTADPVRGVTRFDTQQDVADCVVFSMGELGAPCFHAYMHFAQDEFTQNIPCILLVEKSQVAFVKENAKLAKHHHVIQMPLKMAALRQALYALIAKYKRSLAG